MRKLIFIFMSFLLTVFLILPEGYAQKSPKEVFGFEPGDDFMLADYNMLLEYYQQLANSSERVVYQEIGKSVLGKPLILLIISNEENIKNLDSFKAIAKEQALAKISNDKAISNSINGKSVIWIDAGLHANERATAQMLPLLTYNLATGDDRELVKIRENVISLIMPVMNPDGLDIIAKWYKENLGTPYETTSPPWLYHHYVGHDNNRDWFMNNMPETKAVNHILYKEWFPQIVYNHHQTSPAWARMFVPPFANPVNPHIDPAIVTGTNMVGTAIANRLATKDMSGVVSNYRFSMWWNGGMRTVPYYHNMIGILTETAHATPTPRNYPINKLPKLIGKEVPSDGSAIFYPDPWKGGESKFRTAVDYMYEASLAVLDLAASRKEKYLLDIYNLGSKTASNNKDNFNGYIIPINQGDPSEAVELVNLLMDGGIEVHQLNEKHKVGEALYNKGSFFIPANQAFIAFANDLLSKQEYPIQRKYEGGPLKVPYDLAGWTLPLQMGVQVDKISKNISFKMHALSAAYNPEIEIKGNGKDIKFSAKNNASYKLINHLQSHKVKIYYHKNDDFFYAENGFEFIKDFNNAVLVERVKSFSKINSIELIRPKIGLYKSWIANMDEGWTRWILTEYGFQFDTLHNEDISNSDLSVYDAIIFPNQSPEGIKHGHQKGFMPDQFTGGLAAGGNTAVINYIQDGGRVITFDKSSDFIIDLLGLPIRNITNNLPVSSFFIPGSLLGITTKPSEINYGMPSKAIASFSRSSAFEVIAKKNTGEGGIEYTLPKIKIPKVAVIALYDDNNLLKSGYALNAEKHIGNKIAAVKVKAEQGDVILFGFRPQFRGQSRNTYKMLFNSFYFKK